MRLPNGILSFTSNDEDRKTKYSQIVEYYNNFTAGKKASSNGVSFEEQNAKVLEFFTSEIERMSGRKLDEGMDLAMYCNFTDVKETAFAIVSMITDLIIPDALVKDIGKIADIKNGAWGDSLKVDMTPRDLFVVAKGGRARRTFEITRQFKGERTVLPEVHAISVGISLYDVLRGAYTLAEFISKAVLSIETNMRYDIYDAFAAAMGSLSNAAGDGQLRISGYTQNSAIALAQKVQAWNGGKPAMFVGTKLALSNILPASTNTIINVESDYVKVGYLREFFGFQTLELEQIADYTKEFAVKLDDTKIYVLCPGTDKVVKVFIEGSTLSNVAGAYENANLQQVATLYKSYGVGAFTTALAGEIDL